MHPNPVYHTADDSQNLAFARDRAFGVLSVNGPEGPLVSHVPFILSEDGAWAEMHLVRSNPIARALGAPQRAILAVTGADSYVSPDWYGLDDQVPTWNYVAVHLRGELELRPAEEMRDLLVRQSAVYEGRLLPKTPWLIDKVNEEALAKLLRMIVPCRMRVESIDGTWKLTQNKVESARLGAAEAMAEHGFGAEVRQLAALMRDA